LSDGNLAVPVVGMGFAPGGDGENTVIPCASRPQTMFRFGKTARNSKRWGL